MLPLSRVFKVLGMASVALEDIIVKALKSSVTYLLLVGYKAGRGEGEGQCDLKSEIASRCKYVHSKSEDANYLM